MVWRGSVVLIVAALASCGDNRLGARDGGDEAADAALDGPPPDSVADVDAAPADAGVDAAPRCGDGQLDPGEDCDQPIAGLSGDGCSSTCTNEALTWTNLTPNPAPRRRGHAVAYDSVRHRLVMFGGAAPTSGGAPSDETWEWDGTTWMRMLTLVTPPARQWHTMAFDSARQRVVMFGGEGTSTVLGDTWEWDGGTWTQRVTATSPPASAYGFMAYDPVRQVTVICDSQTWEYDGTTWTKVSDTTPSPQSFTDLVYAGAPGVMLIGGHQNFFWNGTSWTAVSFAAQVPWNGSGPVSAAYDDLHDRVLAVAAPGSDRDGLGVWEWKGGDWIPSQPTDAGGPHGVDIDVAFDRDRGVVTSFGGSTNPVAGGETWDWDGARWREHYASVPPPRSWPQVAYDARRARVVMFGGIGRGPMLGDTWEWDGATWTARTTVVAPSPRSIGGMAYDELRGVVVLYGGFGQTFDAAGASQITRLGDTWEWDGASWQQRSPSSSPDSPGWINVMTFDRAHGYTLRFNGGQTWTWTGTTWVHRATVHTPPDPTSLAYDARRAVPVLYTRTWDAVNQVNVAEVWEWDGVDWIDRGTAPDGGQLLYDPVLARSVLFHHEWYGANASMWTWDGTSWSAPTAIDAAVLGDTKVFDRATRSWFSFGERSGWDTWLGQLGANDPHEQCDGSDADNDGLVRCGDPDCWWRCTPLCAPGELFCDPNAPRCGDGTCSSIEDTALCPADCP